jgi:ribonuclease HI
MMDAISQFWWGDDDNSNKMHWLAWWKLCYPKKEGGMGFRDFHSFNLAMLAKQIWRLVNEPNSLCARVLKAKYYPHGDILKVGPKAGSSFTWQSILAGLPTFKRGMIWRVGNGESINIWTDKWIPQSQDRMVITPRGGTVYTKVSELIDPSTGSWDLQLLNEIFLSVDVGRIIQIPINIQGFDDFIAWSFTRHGRYTVRSGYHLQWRHNFGSRANQLSLPGASPQNPVWKELWRLKIPSKVKIFCWRALHGILPLKCILANRHIGNSGECPICQQGAEDILHLLFRCPTAQDMWEALGLQAAINEALQVDRAGSAVLEHLLRRNDNSLPGFDHIGLKETVTVTCWYLWWMRRRRTHDEEVPPLNRCKMSILSITANAMRAAEKRLTISPARWIRPEPRKVKINVDASYHSDLHAGAVGVVIRDYQGQFIAARCCFLSHVASATLAEAIAMKEGLSLALNRGCNSIIAESDSMETIEACTGEQLWWSESSAIYADCVDMASTFESISFNHIPREANKVADDLAKFSFLNSLSCNWVDEPPSFILNNLIGDVTIV